jgi:hypothetical protein
MLAPDDEIWTAVTAPGESWETKNAQLQWVPSIQLLLY